MQGSIHAYQGFLTRMVYLYYISCLKYTILVGYPRFLCMCFTTTRSLHIRGSDLGVPFHVESVKCNRKPCIFYHHHYYCNLISDLQNTLLPLWGQVQIESHMIQGTGVSLSASTTSSIVTCDAEATLEITHICSAQSQGCIQLCHEETEPGLQSGQEGASATWA